MYTVTTSGGYWRIVTKPVGQLKFNGFKELVTFFLKYWWLTTLLGDINSTLTRFTVTSAYDVLSIKI